MINPARFYMFRPTINYLKKQGHQIDFLIVKKAVMEDLFKKEGWEYTNIMPGGRTISWLPRKVGAAIMEIVTFFKVFKYTIGKKYDLFLTSDALAVVGWLKRVPTLVFFADDFKHMPEYFPFMWMATKLVTPQPTDMGPFSKHQLKYKGNHEWAYINPKYFTPNPEIAKKINPSGERYFIVRLCGFTATHDDHKRGISDENLDRLIGTLEKYGRVFINPEKGDRALPEKFEKYRLQVDPYEIHHVMYYADLFIGDGHTMNSEAGLMGVPSVRINDFVTYCRYMKEEDSYGLTFGYTPDQFEKFLQKIEELAKNKDIKQEWKNKVEKWSKDHIDVTEFLIDLIESYGKKK